MKESMMASMKESMIMSMKESTYALTTACPPVKRSAHEITVDEVIEA